MERRLFHFQTVLVGAGQKQHVLAIQPLETRNGIRRNGFIGVADVGHTIGIGNGGCDIEFLSHTLFLISRLRKSRASAPRRRFKLGQGVEDERLAIEIEREGVRLVAGQCFPQMGKRGKPGLSHDAV